MVKKPSQQDSSRAAVTPEQADELAQRLADKPYGNPAESALNKDGLAKQRRTTISSYESMLLEIENLALKNKRNGVEPRNVSAIVKEALIPDLKNTNS